MITKPKIINSQLIARAIGVGIGVGETFEIHLFEDGSHGEVGLVRTCTFVKRYADCFEKENRPRQDRAYLGVSWEDGNDLGGFVVEI